MGERPAGVGGDPGVTGRRDPKGHTLSTIPTAQSWKHDCQTLHPLPGLCNLVTYLWALHRWGTFTGVAHLANPSPNEGTEAEW